MEGGNKSSNGATPQTSRLANLLMGLKESDSDIASNSGVNMSPLSVVYAPANEVVETVAEACNCRKSRCLKLYCQCFASNTVCGTACKCLSCCNSHAHADVRDNAIKSILDRNPNAFDSKFKLSKDPESDAVSHKTGCRCKKSMCLKKYCECFQAGVSCGSTCVCLNCCNTNKPPPIAADYGTADVPVSVRSALPVSLSGTPQPEGEAGIAQGAEDLAMFAKNEVALTRSLTKGSRPPLPAPAAGGSKRKRSGSQEPVAVQRGLSFTPIGGLKAERSGSAGEGIASATKRERCGSPAVPVFSLRSASPNSINIADALSLLARGRDSAHGTPYRATQISVKLEVDDRKGGALDRTNSSSSDSTATSSASEEDCLSLSGLERRPSLDGSTTSTSSFDSSEKEEMSGRRTRRRKVGSCDKPDLVASEVFP